MVAFCQVHDEAASGKYRPSSDSHFFESCPQRPTQGFNIYPLKMMKTFGRPALSPYIWSNLHNEKQMKDLTICCTCPQKRTGQNIASSCIRQNAGSQNPRPLTVPPYDKSRKGTVSICPFGREANRKVSPKIIPGIHGGHQHR